jgi:ABC-type polysaccharide transport system permease subunit
MALSMITAYAKVLLIFLSFSFVLKVDRRIMVNECIINTGSQKIQFIEEENYFEDSVNRISIFGR